MCVSNTPRRATASAAGRKASTTRTCSGRSGISICGISSSSSPSVVVAVVAAPSSSAAARRRREGASLGRAAAVRGETERGRRSTRRGGGRESAPARTAGAVERAVTKADAITVGGSRPLGNAVQKWRPSLLSLELVDGLNNL